MRTIFIKVASVFFVISILTSCLGSGDNYFEVSEDFAYINYDDQIGKYAMTLRSGPIKADKIDADLIVGQAYYVSYKANYGNGTYAVAERFDLVERDPVPKAQFSLNKPYSNVPEFQLNDSIHPKSIDFGACAPYKWYFDDFWEIKYSIAKKEGDEIEAYYYYDVNGQFENGVALEANQAIIDVRFVKTLKSGSSQDAKNEVQKVMGSLKMFREMYHPTYKDGEEGANVAIKFRYIKDNNNVPTVSYLGSFYLSGSSSQPYYYMTFTKES